MNIALGFGLAVSLSACSLMSPAVDPGVRAEAVADMKSQYECVWYYHLAGDKAKSSRLIKSAVERGKSAGIKGGEIMGVYSEARSAQQQAVLEQAVKDIEGTEPAVENIMGNPGPRQPTETDLNDALLRLYREPCSAL